MTIWRVAAAVLAAVLGVTLGSLGGSAWAQQTGAAPPPVFSAIDENGVDLASGRLTLSKTEASVGQPGAGGLARVNTGSWLRDNLFGGISNDGGSHFTVSLGAASAKFTKSGATFTPDAGSMGQSLTYDSVGGTYTYTTADGSVATFSAALGGLFPMRAESGFITTLVRPDGETLTYTYDNFDASCGSIPCTRLRAVTSNLGFMVKYDFVGDTYATGGMSLSRVTAVNLGYDYCAPTAATCSYSNTWSSSSYVTTPVPNQPLFSTLAVTDSLNRTTTYTLMAKQDAATPESSLITQIVDPAGVTVNIGYDSSNRVHTLSNNVGTWTYDYTTLGDGSLQTTVTDPLAHTRTVVSNTKGQLTSSTDGVGNTTTLTVDATTGLITRVTAPEGNYTAYGYDARGNVTSATQYPKPSSSLPSHVMTAIYPTTCTNPKTCNKPTSVTVDGATTDYTYDANHGGMLTVTSPAGANGTRPQTRLTYVLLKATYLNSSGVQTQSATSVYRLNSSTSCNTAVATGCAGTADETKITFGFGSGTPSNLQLSQQTWYQGSTILSRVAWSYTMQGDLASTNGALGSPVVDVSAKRYDSERQLIGDIGIDPDGAGTGRRDPSQRYHYRADGLLDSVDIGSTPTQTDSGWSAFTTNEQLVYVYDTVGRKTQEKLISGGTTYALTQYSYDAAGRLDCVAVRMNAANFGSPPASACTLDVAGAAGPDRITKYVYDNANRTTGVISGYGTAAQSSETTSYTPNGQVQTVADGDGNLTTYEYDGFDRLTKTRYPSAANGTVSSTSDYEQLTYDDTTWNVSQDRRRDGQVVGFGYDARHNLTSVTAPAASYTYDNADRKLTATENGQTLTWGYNSRGWLMSETGPMGTVGYQYNAAGQRIQTTWPDGYYVTYDLDWTGAVTAIRENGATSGAGVLASFGYDDLGRRTSLTRGNGVVTSYGYDAVSRLQTLTQDLAGTTRDQTLTLGYNPAGQVTGRTSTNSAYSWEPQLYNSNRPYWVNGLNQFTQSGTLAVSHDARGNLRSDGVTTYSYDVANRLTGTSSGAVLSYDPASRLAQSTSSSGTVTKFAYDGADLIAEYDSSGVVQRRYVHGPGADEPLVWYEGAGTSDRRWLTADQQGSILAVTDGTGAATITETYDEYGVPGASNLGRFQYTGQAWVPEVNLYHYKARAYSPFFGRFLQTDPVGYGAGLNIYAYIDDDPINGTDPSGMEPPSVSPVTVYAPRRLIAADFSPSVSFDAGARLDHFGNELRNSEIGGVTVVGKRHQNLGLASLISFDGSGTSGNGPQNDGTKTCRGNFRYSGVDEGQAPHGALGFPPPLNSVAISPEAFGLPYGTIPEREAAQAAIRRAIPSIRITASGLTNLQGLGPTFTIGDVGNRDIRNSPVTRFDIYRFPKGGGSRFGKQTASTVITGVPSSWNCPS